jgi:hypothetical protein
MRIINKQIQRIHGNYDPASPLMIKKHCLVELLVNLELGYTESVAVRFEEEI